MSAVVHFVHDGILFLLLIYGIIALAKPVVGSSLALCEGGQTCLPPKECCAQGCCYLYAPPGAPRIPMASNDHVLSLLFLNHWYFWCFTFAIVLALLCTCSLWKKRRQLCGWDTSARHSQSEGDSAGSCYAPPQYSRCNSFHIHAPPPYTEVASKPDLYPLVFSYTDPGKGNGANYLMVQYFRNYIVQPVGSISGTSTVDSLSSSFICNANEANTLVPPPYSRAASPDNLTAIAGYRNYLLPRSASQQVCLAAFERAPTGAGARSQPGGYPRDDDSLLLDQQQCMLASSRAHQPATPLNSATINRSSNSASSNNVSLMECGVPVESYHARRPDHGPSQPNRTGGGGGGGGGSSTSTAYTASEIEQPGAESSESLDGAPNSNSAASAPVQQAAGTRRHGTSEPNCDPSARSTLVCKLCCSTGDIAIGDRRPPYRPQDLAALHKSLETCCHVNLHAGEQPPRRPLQPAESDDSLLHAVGTGRKHDASSMRNSCVMSSVGSNVSSLVNLDGASSPPRATSPTAEVRELLEQIRQLHSEEEPAAPAPVVAGASVSGRSPAQAQSYRRPSSLIGRRGKLFSKPGAQHGTGKGMYIPISFTQSCVAGTSGHQRHLRSPASMSNAASSFLNRGRQRYCWMSKSAPTTPGAAPGSFAGGGTLSDNRPLLLTEHEEDGEQNV